MHNARGLVVDSVTGVDLALPVAGPGARSYAFLIDWVIRAILFSAWYGVAAVLYNRRWTFIAPLSPDAKWFVLVVMPAAAMYFLYHFVLEIAMHGRTPGKRMAGVHIVTREGGSPGIGALLTRNVFRLVDCMPLLYGVGLITALATRDHVRVGDMAAGTLLVYERHDVALPETGAATARQGRARSAATTRKSSLNCCHAGRSWIAKRDNASPDQLSRDTGSKLPLPHSMASTPSSFPTAP